MISTIASSLVNNFTGSIMAPNSAAQLASLKRTNDMHFDSFGKIPSEQNEASSFDAALAKAMDGVNATQMKADNIIEQMVTSPDSVDPQDVTVALAQANMDLNLARTILSRIVTGWKDIINTR